MTLDEWIDSLDEVLGIGQSDENIRDVVLDLARDAAHGICRPAAPLTTYLLGVAVGRGADPREAAALIRAAISATDPLTP